LIASLNGSRYEHILVVAHEKLFAIGGKTDCGNCLSSSVEQLCCVDGKSKEVKSMNAQRCFFAAVSCNNFIYAIGGWNNNEGTLDSVEKYDVNKNKWSLVNSMIVDRKEHAACVSGGKIFSVGGASDKGNKPKAIEIYDSATDEWTVVGETEKVSGHAVITI